MRDEIPEAATIAQRRTFAAVNVPVDDAD